MKLIADLERGLSERAANGLLRTLHTLDSPQGARCLIGGREWVNFASNDYLGLANHPDLIAAARTGATRWGVGAGASHMLSGHSAPHAALEDELARFVAPCRGARALLFSTGYLANLAILTALAGRDDAIFADRLNHASLNDGALLSRAALVRYAHGDVGELERRLVASTARRKLIATDAVFSMDGDVAPLPQVLALAEAADAWLVVDDAHGFGVLGDAAEPGRGTLAHFGIASERIVYMATLGKAAGCAGAFVCAHPAVIDTLMQTARSYIFTTAAPPLLAEVARIALRIMRHDRARPAHLHALITRFRERMRALPWMLLPSTTAIQPLLVGGNEAAVALSTQLSQHGFWVPAIRPPTVPAGTARLRITLTAAHTTDEIDALADVLAELAPTRAIAQA